MANFIKIFFITTILASGILAADPYPPEWNGGAGAAIHFDPVLWPNEPADPLNCTQNCGDWLPYTRFDNGIADPRTQDPSNGGTSPQNYVNIASSCIDKTYPSVYYHLYKDPVDSANDVLMFRWRVEQIANTYATGPNPGNFSATDPWNSALWTVFFDIDGDGFRDLAAHLDGSSGSPSTKIDSIFGIWGTIPTQSIDYLTDPAIHVLAHNPTAFVDGSTILNFQDSLTPVVAWSNGAAETSWDYGTTRAKLITESPCNEYFIDYQIPVAMLDASGEVDGAGNPGPAIDRDTPLSMLFCTANSLNNPFQKDCAINKQWAADPTKPAPFGDFVTFNDGSFQQPIVDSIEAVGCGPVALSAAAKDVLAVINGEVVTSVQAVDFYYYHDADANGIVDDGNAWTFAVSGSAQTLTQWTANWDSSGLPQGQYLIGVQALDDHTLVDDGMPADGNDNRTFSYLTQAEVDALGNDPNSSGEDWWANPDVTGQQSVAVTVNACGTPPPSVSKTVDSASVTADGPVQFTISVANTLDSSITLTSITDSLPAGFTYLSTDGGTLTPVTSPTLGAGGNISWTFAPATIAPASSETLIFTATATAAAGIYANNVNAETSAGTLTGDPVQVNVGTPRLTITKSADSLSLSPGDTVTYTITYANDSSIDASNAVITDILPAGLTIGSVNDGGSYNAGNRTITWNVGNLVAGSGPYTVSFTATVDDPYPAGASVPLVNTGTIDSDQTDPADSSIAIFVDTPRPGLSLVKSADKPLVDPQAAAPGNQVTFAIGYANDGTAEATNVVISDNIPSGFTYQSASPAPASAPLVGGTGTVTWTIGTVTAGATGSVSLTLQAVDPYTGSNPMTNTASIDSDETAQVTASSAVGVLPGETCQTYYLKNATANVGSAGSQNIATTSAPVSGTATDNSLTGVGNTAVELGRFYQDPVPAGGISFSGDITATVYINKSGAPQLFVQAESYDYDPVSGAVISLGSQQQTVSGNKTNEAVAFAITPSAGITSGHRILWVVSAATNHASNTNDAGLLYDGTPSPSRFAYCSGAAAGPAQLVIDKSVDLSSASAGDTLVYTVHYANIGGASADNAAITETLPAGVTYAGAALNGGAVFPSASAPPVYTFALGNLAAGASGTLEVTVAIDDPLDGLIASLLNNASIDSDQTAPVEDSALTTIVGSGNPGGPPLLTINKTVDKSSVLPGETVTYTLTVLNSGGGTANNISVTDDMPDQPYFTYTAASISGGDARNDSGDPLTWTINSLAPGASAVLSFQMTVAGGGVPDGITVLDNSATLAESQVGVVNSNTVSVAVNTNADLDIVKSVTPNAGTSAPGDTLVYTLEVANNGSGAANNVVVFDPIPANTAFVAVTQGTGSFDAVNNRVAFSVGTIAAGVTETLAFSVRIVETLENGATDIDNTATATASNAAEASASVNETANAAPVLEVDKIGPAQAPLPSARLTEDASGAATVFVDNNALLVLGQTVVIDNQPAVITGIAGNSITLDTAVTALSGTEVVGAITYAILYSNSGNADASGVTIDDTLTADFGYLSAVPTPDTAPAIGDSGLVSWSIANLAAGQSGSVSLTVFPKAVGTLINSADLFSNVITTPVSDAVDTVVGGLIVKKLTTTPVVAQTPGGTSATYTIQVENMLADPVSNVVVTDTLASGFTFASTDSITGGTLTAPVPAGGDSQPQWGTFTIAANSVLEITFTVDIADSVGPATYQNEVSVAAQDGVAVTQFDPLQTTAEDVTVLLSGTGLVEGYVYLDNDGSGTFNAGDTPYTGVGVEITDSGATYIVFTDASGYFRRVVAAGSVTVDVDESGLPAGLVLTTNANDEGTDPTTVTVPDGGSARDNTGYIVPVTGNISGHIFEDTNGNGTQEASEPDLEGVDVVVTDSLGVSQTVTTDANGDWSATVQIGEATTDIDETILPAGSVQTAGSDPTTTDVTEGATANAGEDGYQLQGTVSGHIFEDTDGNGVQDAGEPDLAGVDVVVTDSLGAAQTVTTDAGGNWSATVPAGNTTADIDESTLPAAGMLQTAGTDPTDVTVTAGQTADARIDGFQVQAAPPPDPENTISGIVYHDINGNGIQDPGEPGIEGVVVELFDSNGNSLGSDITAADGSFVFNSLPTGTYTLVETDLNGYSSTTPNSVQVSVNSSATADFGDRLLDGNNGSGNNGSGKIANVPTLSGNALLFLSFILLILALLRFKTVR